MNTVNSYTVINPYGKEDECAQFTIDDLGMAFAFNEITTPGQDYTFRFWVKSESEGSVITGGSSFPTSSTWTLNTVTFTANSIDFYLVFGVVGTYYIYHPKLEIGNKPTDYTVAPEDTDDTIKDADNKASAADSKATEASNKADAADGKATEASNKAAEAIDKANAADSKATEASKTATNHMIFNESENSGLEIGDYTTGKWLGFRARITAEAFEIVDSNDNVVASYGIDEIELGNNSEEAIIKLCGGHGQIKMDAYKDFMQIYGDAIALKSEHEESAVIDGITTDSVYNAIVRIATNTTTQERSIYIGTDEYHLASAGLPYGSSASILFNSAGVAIEAGGQSEADYMTGVYLYDDRINISTCEYEDYEYGMSHGHIEITTDFVAINGDLAVNKNLSIGGINVDDFVVDRGTSGSWTYKKWNSGTCELWCSVSVSNLDCKTALGSMYRTNEISTPSFPFTVTNPNIVSSYESPGYGAMLWPTGTTTTTTKPTNYYLVRPTSTTIVSGTINLQVKGKWK